MTYSGNDKTCVGKIPKIRRNKGKYIFGLNIYVRTTKSATARKWLSKEVF